MTGVIDMSNNATENLPVPADDHSAVNKKWVDDTFAKKSDLPITGITQQQICSEDRTHPSGVVLGMLKCQQHFHLAFQSTHLV
jgi:hypothetical protein